MQLLDFGRSIDTTLYQDGTVFVGDSVTQAFRCIEMQTGKPWTFQVRSCGCFHRSISSWVGGISQITARLVD